MAGPTTSCRRAAWAAVAALLAACATAPEPPQAPQPPPQVARLEEPPASRPAPRPEFCATLASLMSDELGGYARLRAEPLDRERWLAALTLPGTQRCLVEGEGWPRARFTCAGPPIAREESDLARAVFEAMASEIDRCLEKPIWFPRDWHKGRRFEFAMGERMQTWTDQTTSPPSSVVLKVLQDLASRDYRLELNLETVR